MRTAINTFGHSFDRIIINTFVAYSKQLVRPEEPQDPNPRYSPQPIIPQPPKSEPLYDENDERMNIVGQNGNDGIHYEEDEIIPDVSESSLEEDLYSRDAKKATIPAAVGEVLVEPETVNTDNASSIPTEKPTPAEHITPVGDPLALPKDKVKSRKKKANNIVGRTFKRPTGS